MYTWNVLKENAKQAKSGQWQNYVRIQNIRRSNGKTTKLGKKPNISTWSYKMDVHAKKCVERYCDLVNKTTQHFHRAFNSMPWWPSIQRRGIEFRRKIVKSLLSNRPEMSIFGSHRHSKVGKQTCLRSQNGPELVTNDQLVWSLTFISRVNLNRIVVWGHTAQQCRLGLFQNSDFAGDLEGIDFRRNVMYFRQSHGCSCKLDVQEADSSPSHSSTESEMISLDAGLRMGFPLSIFGIWSVKSSTRHLIKHKDFSEYGETRCLAKHQGNARMLRARRKFRRNVLNYPVSIVFPRTLNLLVSVPRFTFLKTLRQ